MSKRAMRPTAASPPMADPADDSPNLYELLAESSSEILLRLAPDRRILFSSPSAGRIIGYSADDLIGRRLDDLVHSEDLAAVLTAFALQEDAKESASVVYRLKRGDGEFVWLESDLSAILPPRSSGVAEFLCVSRDVTRYKRIEKAIEKVAREWRQTFDSAQDVIVMLDHELRVIRANRAATELFALPFQGILGRKLEELLGVAQPAPLFDVSRLQGAPGHIEEEVHLPDRDIWVRCSLDPTFGEGDELTGCVVFISDVSERKRAEQQLRTSLRQLRDLSSHLQSVREEERARIAREVHDELGHALTALKMEVSWVDRHRDQGGDSLADRTRSMSELLDRTIATVRRIATELRPSVLDDLGLEAAIEWQAGDFGERTGIATEVVTSGVALEIDRDRSSAVFRILQEALTNVARHAEARRVRVSLVVRGGRLSLHIADDGRGFDPGGITRVKSFGLLGMRERALMLGGTVEVTSNAGVGTEVHLEMPLEGPGSS